MTEQATTTAPAVELPEALQKAFETLSANPAYAGVVPMLTEKLGAHYSLVLTNNADVAAIQESRDTDPNSAEYQDLTWKRVAAEKKDKEIVAAEKRYQAAIEAMEKELKVLREKSKSHMRPALSEKEIQEKRKSVNDNKSVIADSAKANEAIAAMADQMLAVANAPVENGIWSLMPQPESLMNARGRKSGTSDRGERANFTRLAEATINGKPSGREVTRRSTGDKTFSAHFNFIADDMSRMFGAKEFPANAVTAEDLEAAYYASKGVEYRDAAAMPLVHEFEFTKDVVARNGADGTEKSAPVTVKVSITRWTKETAGLDDKSADKSEDNKAEDNKPEENKGEAEKANA